MGSEMCIRDRTSTCTVSSSTTTTGPTQYLTLGQFVVQVVIGYFNLRTLVSNVVCVLEVGPNTQFTSCPLRGVPTRLDRLKRNKEGGWSSLA